MKASKFAVVLSSAVLLASGLAQAESAFDNNAHQNQFVAKRAYHQPLADSVSQQGAQWEGATLIKATDANQEILSNQHKALRVNTLSKRPY